MQATTAGNLKVAHDNEEQSTKETVEQLVEIVTEQAEVIDELRDEVEDLREEIEDERSERTRNDAEIRKRVTDIEEADTTDANPKGEDDTNGLVEPQTALEDVATVPDTILDDESANTQRAVFVARDVREYSQSVPAGFAITSSDLRTILRAGTESRGHTQTVSRVMDLLDDLGEDEVRIVERRGTKRIVFDEELVARLETLTAQKQSRGCGRART